MFEKEAEERFVKSYPEFCWNGKPLSPYWDLWQDGAEFGYNKAKEENKTKWHKVADGDYPPCEKGNYTISVLTDRGDIAYYSYDNDCWVAEPSSVEIDPPIAWCELQKFEENI